MMLSRLIRCFPRFLHSVGMHLFYSLLNYVTTIIDENTNKNRHVALIINQSAFVVDYVIVPDTMLSSGTSYGWYASVLFSTEFCYNHHRSKQSVGLVWRYVQYFMCLIRMGNKHL